MTRGKTVFLEYPNGDIEYDCKSDDCEGLRLKDVLAHLREIGEPYLGEVWKKNDVDLLAKWGVEDLELDEEAIPAPFLMVNPTVSHDTKSVEVAASPMVETPNLTSRLYAIDMTEEDIAAFEADSDPKMLSDVGNGARMAGMFGNFIRYCKDNGLWYIWTGRRWKADHTMFVYKLAKRVVKSIRDEAYALPEEDVEQGEKSMRDILLGWHATSMKKERLIAMVWCALSEGNISVQAKDFDKNHDLLNFLNGTLDLRTMTFRKHRQSDLITKVIPYNLDPMATCPKWEEFMSDIMSGDADDVDFLQRFGGYSLCGDISEQCFIILWGDGSNGKSTFVGTIRKIEGQYTAQATFDTFTDDKNKPIRNDLAALKGVRLVAASESEKGTKLSEAVIKHLTGGEEVTCRFLNHEFFSYLPTYKIWLSTNHKPRIRGVDDGIWRRVRLVEFKAKFKKELGNINERLQDELMAEAPGIINWLIAGYLKWKATGLPLPENVKNATANYRSEQDTLALFLEDACEVAPTLFTHSQSTYLAYKRWAEEQGERPMGSKNFKAAMEERGFKHDHKKVNGKTQRVFLGVRVIFDTEESPKWVEEIE
jgi:putative DNA primase/helicase